MTTAMFTVLGIIVAAIAALMSVYYGGSSFDEAHVKAEAGRLVSEGAQLENAITLFAQMEKRMPGRGDSASAAAELVSKKYLTHIPLGMEKELGDNGRWTISYQDEMIYSKVGAESDDAALEVCQTARKQLNLPNPDTVYKCDGSDNPAGKLSRIEPCCIKG